MDKIPWLDEVSLGALASKYPFSGGQIDNIAKKAALHEILNVGMPSLELLNEFCQNEVLSNSQKRIGFK